MVFRLISSLGGATEAEKAPWRRENKYEKFLVPVAMMPDSAATAAAADGEISGLDL